MNLIPKEMPLWVETQAYFIARATQYRNHPDGKCGCGKKSYADMKLYGFDDDYGWEVEGFIYEQWLFFLCPECGYQWAIWKIGVPKDHKFKKNWDGPDQKIQDEDFDYPEDSYEGED